MSQQRDKQMNRGEPVTHDVDLVDARIMDETSTVDWHAVSESEAASFGLSLGLYRDQVHVYEKRRVAWGTGTGSVLSISAMAAVAMLTHAGGWFAVSLIIFTQAFRAGWLYWKMRQSEKDIKLVQDSAIDNARHLAGLHPAKQ
jgi:hypothetical protein